MVEGDPSPAKKQRTASPEAECDEQLAYELLRACEKGDESTARSLIERGAAAWYDEGDGTGWTALHFAATHGNAEFITYLLRHGGVWNISYTPGDVAFSMNHAEAYEVLLQEGIRSQLLELALEAADGADEDDEDTMEPSVTNGHVKPSTAKTSADDNATFLKTRLRFVGEPGNEVCVDADDNAVMMAWERPIMERTAQLLMEGLKPADEEAGLSVMNVGFGLGLIDTALQRHSPAHHLIIEPHPDVLAHMRRLGWYEKPAVTIFEGKWQDWLEQVEQGSFEARTFDAMYFDTFSEHYRDLRAFFEIVPNVLNETGRFSFFHGLGATSRTIYDVFTAVSEIQLREIGLSTSWTDAPVEDSEVQWNGIVRRYWDVASAYRLPICTLEDP